MEHQTTHSEVGLVATNGRIWIGLAMLAAIVAAVVIAITASGGGGGVGY
jgi:hypothetical protein